MDTSWVADIVTDLSAAGGVIAAGTVTVGLVFLGVRMVPRLIKRFGSAV